MIRALEASPDVIEYLDRFDPDAAAVSRGNVTGCLTPWQRDPATYRSDNGTEWAET